MKKIRLRNLLFLIPVLPIFIWWAYYSIILPTPFYDNQDPETQYFIESLSVFNGEQYKYIDHPGIPVSIIGSILLAFTYPLTIGQDFTIYHLNHPQIFFQLVQVFMMLAFSFSAIYFYKTASAMLSKELLPIAIILPMLFFVLHPKSFMTITLWSHNSFNYPFGMLLSVILINLTVQKSNITPKSIFLFGFLNGILAAVQLYFSAWVISAAIAMFLFFIWNQYSFWNAAKKAFLSLSASAIGFFISIVPAYKNWGYFFEFIKGIASHQGHYGVGEDGFISYDTAIRNFQSLLYYHGAIIIISIASIIIFLCLIVAKKFKADAGLLTSGITLSLQIILLIFMFIKHSGGLYPLAIASTAPVLLLINLRLLNFTYSKQWIKRIYLIAIIMITIYVGIQTITNFNINANIQRSQKLSLQREKEVIQQFIAEYANLIKKTPAELVVLYTYEVKNECSALLYGQSYAQPTLYKKMSIVCPNQYELFIWNGQALVNGQLKELQSTKWDIIFFKPEVIPKQFSYLLELGVSHNLRSKLTAVTPR